MDLESSSSGEAEKTPGFDPVELEGADAKVAELAAHRLLQSISTKDEKADAARAAHMNYLLDRLQPARLAQASAEGGRASDFVSAGRIVDALATWTTSSGPPFVQASEVVQPLLGVGPGFFRSAVIRAHRALVLHELKTARRLDPPAAGGGSATLAALTAKLTESPPPPESFVRDACQIYWETDGKGLLGALVSVLLLHSGAPAGAPGAGMANTCIDELESRVALNFPTVEGWQKWWSEVRDWSLERILADAQRRTRGDYLAMWRQMLRRLRETGDTERLFLAIQDTVDGMYVPELRAAAVAALGDFAEWVVDLPASQGADKVSGADPRDRLLSKGVERLCALCEARGVPAERPEVLRAALSSLRKYHAFLDRNPPLLSKVSRIVADRVQELSLEGKARTPEDLAETLRIAGALHVSQAQAFVEALLREVSSAQEPDLELVTTAVTCLGRLLEQGLSSDDAGLVLAQFRKPRAGTEKALKELRRACLTALGSGSESPQVRADLRTFFKDVLWGSGGGGAGAPPRGEKELRIPAILGLGTLARQKDAGAFDALAEILLRQDQFEAQEVAAAIDSLSYLGGRPVITALVRCLTEVKDKGLEDHLRKKLLSLVDAGGGSGLAWALEDLEARAFAEESLTPLEQALALALSPQAKDLVSTEKADPSSGARIELLYKTISAVARASDLLGKEDEMNAALSQLADLLQKAPALKEKLPDSVTALAAFRASLALRGALKAKLSKLDVSEPAALSKELDALVLSDASVTGRWRNLRWGLRQLAGAPPSERVDRLRAAWQATLASEGSRPLWEGFPPKFRERFLGRLEALNAEKGARPN